MLNVRRFNKNYNNYYYDNQISPSSRSFNAEMIRLMTFINQ